MSLISKVGLSHDFETSNYKVYYQENIKELILLYLIALYFIRFCCYFLEACCFLTRDRKGEDPEGREKMGREGEHERKKKKPARYHHPCFQVVLQSYTNKNCLVLI